MHEYYIGDHAIMEMTKKSGLDAISDRKVVCKKSIGK